MPLRSAASSPLTTSLLGDRPVAGEYVPPREQWSSASVGPGTSGTIAVTFWTADKSEAINNVRVTTGATAAGATPTLCRMGIYSVNAAGDLTALLASTVNDTTLFATANTAYSKALSSQFDKVAGVRYATALLVVSAAAIPGFVGAIPGSSATATHYAQNFELPALCSRVTAQTDLGASYTRAQQLAYAFRVGFTLT